MTTIFIPGVCKRCLIFKEQGEINFKNNKILCPAFPAGIPEQILTGKFDHTRKYPGQQNDILYEPIKED